MHTPCANAEADQPTPNTGQTQEVQLALGPLVTEDQPGVAPSASLPGQPPAERDLGRITLTPGRLPGLTGSLTDLPGHVTVITHEQIRRAGVNTLPEALRKLAGVHVHGVLSKASTYEAISPELVGAKRRIVVGKLIGAHGIRDRLAEIGVKVSDSQLQEVTKKVKDLGDRGKKIVEEDLIAIAEDTIGKLDKKKRKVELVNLILHSELNKNPVAEVELTVDGKAKSAKEEGVGPVDATLNAIRSAIGDKDIQLEEYHLDAITGGSDALADVTIRVRKNGAETMASGVHEDVVMASVKAFINGLNRILK